MRYIYFFSCLKYLTNKNFDLMLILNEKSEGRQSYCVGARMCVHQITWESIQSFTQNHKCQCAGSTRGKVRDQSQMDLSSGINELLFQFTNQMWWYITGKLKKISNQLVMLERISGNYQSHYEACPEDHEWQSINIYWDISHKIKRGNSWWWKEEKSRDYQNH